MSAKDKCWRASLSTGLYWRWCGCLPEHALGWRAFFAMVRGDAFGEGVSMNSQHLSSVCEMLAMPRECLFNIDFFKLCHGFIQKNLAVQHFIDQAFELGAQLQLAD